MSITNTKILNFMKLPTKPVTADIFLTAFCNNKCKYCTYKRWGLDSNRYMTFEEFKNNVLILQNKGVKGFILTGGGEPTCSPDFDLITEYLEQNGIEYGINTNFNILKFIKPVYLKVSLDGYNAASYKNIRGVDKYHQVRQNIIKYDEWRKTNSPLTHLSIQCVGDSIKTIKKFYKANKDLPVDAINIRPIESTCGTHYPEEPTKIIQFLEKFAKQDPRIKISPKWYQTKSIPSICYANRTVIAINEKSEVLQCCHKPYKVLGSLSYFSNKLIPIEHDTTGCDVPCRLSGPNQLIKESILSSHKNFI